MPCSGVTINTYKVIYNLIDDVKAAMEGKLRSVEERLPLGEATVRRRQPLCPPPAHCVTICLSFYLSLSLSVYSDSIYLS
jgi:hypothetical protein